LEINKDFILEISTVPLELEKQERGTLVILHDVSREKLVERLKTEFVSIAAHQLRTPLSAIKWTLKMLLDGDLGEINEEQREFLLKTYKSNERMIALINSLLSVTRIEEGRFLYNPGLNKLDELVESVLESLTTEAKRKQINLIFKKQKDLPKLFMDIEKMRLTIYNLIDNAIRYTLPGGKIEVELSKKGKRVEFMVKDSGIGIPGAQQKRIFSKFFRGLNALRLETEGSGLGLFITKNIIESHGGEIWFESEENNGTTFYFALPIKKEFEEFLEKF
jgi:signal transduction histidine kinase